MECYGSSRPRDGSASNEDAFWIQRPASAVAVLCDGAGNAQHCAAHVVRQFARQVESAAFDVQRFPAWSQWIRTTDAAMAGGPQTTFVAVAVVEDRLVGAYAGDSRAYIVNEAGCRVLTEQPGKRLGSGEADASPVFEPLQPRDTVLLMSDGAWTPLPLTIIHRQVMAARLQAFADLPGALLDAAGRHGRADDMTVIALRLR